MATIVSDMIFKILIEWDDDSRLWVTRVPELNDLSTFGETEEEALQMTKDAILGYLEAVKQVGEPEAGSHSRILELTV
jgi:predicted RNase H-like HicB family nuclease